jgi:1,4-dihydroxy-2-naphthoate octaprenyltransferase
MSERPNARTPERPNVFSVWLLACRPKTLVISVAPVIVGSAVASAGGGFRWGPALAALLGAVMIQVGTNLANDVFDFEKGADRPDRIGPLRVTQAGLLTPRQVRAGMVAAFGIAVLAGIYLTAVAGWPVIAIGLAGIAAGIVYTAGPYALAYRGLGDVFVMVFFGFVAVVGTVYVQSRDVSAVAWTAAVPIGALATAVLVVNNIRDLETDRRAGRRTLPVVFGRRAGVAEFVGLLAVAYAAPVGTSLAGLASPWSLSAWISLPLAVGLARRVATATDGPTLNRDLAGTARLLLLYAVLFSAGLLAGRYNKSPTSLGP